MLHLQENVVGHIVLDKLSSYRSVHAPDSNVVFLLPDVYSYCFLTRTSVFGRQPWCLFD